jgi:hypothetical protein
MAGHVTRMVLIKYAYLSTGKTERKKYVRELEGDVTVALHGQ